MGTKERIGGLLEYVERMVRLGERPVLELKSYRDLLFLEEDLADKVGLIHDPSDDDGTWLKIARLPRTDPPTVPKLLEGWVDASRDPENEPTVQRVVSRTLSVTEVEALISKGELEPSDVGPALKGGPSLRDVILRLDGLPHIQSEFQEYLSGPWARWAATERPRRETMAIYDAFFRLHQQITSAGVEDPIEVVWGIGIARWRTDKGTIDHPIIEQLVEIDIDMTDGAMRLRPRSIEPQVSIQPFAATENPEADTLRAYARQFFGSRGEEEEFSPFVRRSFESVLKQAANLLDPQGVYWPEVAQDASDRTVPRITDHLVVTDTWAIYARPRSNNFILEDVERLKNAVNQSAETDLPTVAHRLVNEADNSLPSGYTSETGRPSEAGGMAPPGDANRDLLFYFPKAFNDEQIQIVKRLEQEDGVVVQGPPGTGKTHTIANIICHYLATGRRVLVVSKGEPALEVLRDHIPPEIRDLSISLLTSERSGLKQLERAVSTLADQVSNANPKVLARDIDDAKRRLERLQHEIAAIDKDLLSFAEENLRPVAGMNGIDSLPIDVAKTIVVDKARHAWFEDRPALDKSGEPKFSDEDIVRIRLARQQVGRELGYLDVRLPNANDLIDSTNLASVHNDLANAERIAREAAASNFPHLSLSTDRAIERASIVLEIVKAMIECHQALEEHAWLKPIVDSWLTKPESVGRTALFEELRGAMRKIAVEREKVVLAAVQVPEQGLDRDDLREALVRVSQGKSPFPPIAIGKRQAKEFYAEVRVKGGQISSVEHASQVLIYISWRDQVGRFCSMWRSTADELSLPALPDDGNQAGRWIANISEVVEGVWRAAQGYREVLTRDLPNLFPAGLDVTSIAKSREAATHAQAVIVSNLTRLRLADSRQRLVDLKRRLNDASGLIVDEMRDFLSNQIGDPDIPTSEIAEGWDTFLSELRRLTELGPQFRTIRDVTERIANSGASKWAAKLKGEPATGGVDLLTPAGWRESWRWAQLEGYLQSIDKREKIAEISIIREEADSQRRRLFSELVRLMTYQRLNGRMTNLVRAALVMFMEAIRRVGAGSGISARRFRRDARHAMDRCYTAVPCWIMPEWRVSENLPPIPGSFDLVIVDEASQSDMRAVPAILRGKKVLIVGDDRQVSPTPVGIEERDILSLRRNYLEDQPYAALMLPGGSLYVLMGAVFPGDKIMLKEHFRCVEPIIRFSFQFYNGEIKPLRIPKASERLDPPLIDVYVPHGQRRGQLNPAEAEVVVDEIQKIVGDPNMAGRSIGVISLIGKKQARLIYSLLIARIGEEAYQRHQITCGDSATFQGKERDIVVLSMVACPGTAHGQISRIFEQRFNVALSRARDREILVRSLKEEDLKNPNDLKVKVLRHFRSPMGRSLDDVTDLIDLCESAFEGEVFKRLVASGYNARPQVRAGQYRIDLVVEGAEDRRLAIELDGDKYHGPERWFEDYQRQLALERVGWRFWRCWGSSWTLDPESCFNDLTQKLREMGIEPSKGEVSYAHYTETREAQVPPGGVAPTPSAEGAPPASERGRRSLGLRARAQASLFETSMPQPKVSEDVFDGAQSAAIRVGDRVVVAFNDEPNQHITYVIDKTRNDPDLYIINEQHKVAQALLGAVEEDEVEIPAGGRLRLATVLKVERREP